MVADTETNDIETMSMKDFLNYYGGSIKEKVRSSLIPVFQKGQTDDWDKSALKKQACLARKPFAAQAATVCAVAKGLFKEDRKSVILVGEMGSGKTLMGIGVSSLIPKANSRVLILCPSHLVKKWAREIRETDRGATKVEIITKISDVALTSPQGREYWIVSKEKAKLHYQERKSVWMNRRHVECCPDCGKILDEDDKGKCRACGSSLYCADGSKFRRFSLAEYIRKHKKFCQIDLLIADEVHELKGGDTSQGQALHSLIVSSKKCLAMTGTLMGGYASNLYHLLFRLFTRKMINAGYKHNSSVEFSSHYGMVEIIEEVTTVTTRTASIGGKDRLMKKTKEKPGISPLLLPHFLLEDSVYIWISDISDQLPAYSEHIELVDMTEEQKDVYMDFQDDLSFAVKNAMSRHDHRLLGALVNSLYALPDGARRGESVLDPNDKEKMTVLCSAVPLDIPALPKEERLREIVLDEKLNGRKCAIFLEHTGTRDLIPELTERLENSGIKTLVLRSDTVATQGREEWLQKMVKDENPDVLICNPNLVKTGLDLLDFPTIVYFQTGMSIYTMRQSSRRSWRIGQKKPIKVYFMAYRQTAQERALKLIATKLETSNAVEGKLAADGLSAMSSGDGSMVLAMARSIMGEDKDKRSLNAVWNGYQSSEQVKDRGLFDSGLDNAFKVFSTPVQTGKVSLFQ